MGLEDVRKLERDSDAKLADPRIYPISPSCNRLPCHGASSKDNLLFTTTCWDRSAISWFSTLLRRLFVEVAVSMVCCIGASVLDLCCTSAREPTAATSQETRFVERCGVTVLTCA